MTREEMERCGRLGLRICWAQLEKRRNCDLLIAMWRRSTGKLEEFTTPEKAGKLLNKGAAKRLLFHLLRRWANNDPDIEAVILGSDTYFARATPEGMKHAEEMRYGAVDREFKDWLAKGWAERLEAIVVTVQTPDEVLTVRRFYTRRESKPFVVPGGEVEVEWAPQSAFGGRMKMYGDFSPENLGENPEDQVTVEQLDQELMRVLGEMDKERTATP